MRVYNPITKKWTEHTLTGDGKNVTHTDFYGTVQTCPLKYHRHIMEGLKNPKNAARGWIVEGEL
jgi:hypothetical protein